MRSRMARMQAEKMGELNRARGRCQTLQEEILVRERKLQAQQEEISRLQPVLDSSSES
jgi:hypothetical protein